MIRSDRRAARLAAYVALLAAGVGAQAPPRRPLPRWPDSVSAGDWQLPGRDHGMTRFSPLDQINAGNVQELRPVWRFETGVADAHEGNPLVVGATMYVHTPFPNAVVALDLTRPEGPPLWRYAVPEATAGLTVPSGCCGAVSRGLAYHPSGIVFAPLFHGELAALDARTGREIWRVRNADYRAGGSMPGAPLVAKDLVIVGTGGAEYGVRGHLTAYLAANGQLVWRAYHTGPDRDLLLDADANPHYASHRGPDLGVSSWPPDGWKLGGATASGWISYDAELELVYYGTDQPAPATPLRRGGDNKWAATIMARSASTGKLRWALQLTPHDEWGYGASNENILVDLTMRGAPVKALVHLDRNGFGYTIDRATGRLLLGEPLGPVNWATRIDRGTGAPIREPRFAVSTRPLASVCPAAAGMKGLGPAAFSPASSLFFVPLNNLCMNLQAAPVTYAEGQPYAGTRIRVAPGPGGSRGRFIAWDARTGAIVWQIQEPYPVTGGALATAGGLVFYGTMDGWLKAVDAGNGRDLWRYKTPSGVMGSPITFTGPDRKQYVAVLSGLGGWLARGGEGATPEMATITQAGGVLMVFGL
jgi:PQQ-dependent dehydrogenase (methanol/ethanol family)